MNQPLLAIFFSFYPKNFISSRVSEKVSTYFSQCYSPPPILVFSKLFTYAVCTCYLLWFNCWPLSIAFRINSLWNPSIFQYLNTFPIKCQSVAPSWMRINQYPPIRKVNPWQLTNLRSKSKHLKFCDGCICINAM